ncbi:MAG: chromosome partitioning protein [Herpetosiphonaceae bacterium]|nr:MAG: chromosome partitioning protein [Herpetosiphonaceae bacterium]
MKEIELLIVSTTPGLPEALSQYEGLRIAIGPTLRFAENLITSVQPPNAVYVEDTGGTLDQLWSAIHAAQSRGIPMFIGLHSVGLAHQTDFTDAGLAVTTDRDGSAIASWLASLLGVRARAAAHQTVIAVAGAKGGIGKTLLVALLAEGMKRRGLRVLVVDGDLSNSGIVPTFRIPSGFPSYLQLREDGPAAWTPQNVRRIIYRHRESGIDFLLGSEETADVRDLVKTEWEALMQAVRSLSEYDVVLLDTGPEIKKRPYALIAARDGGWVVLPTPPGRKERIGVGNALRVFQAFTPDLTPQCRLVYMEPEKGVKISVDDIRPLFQRHFPAALELGVLPRAPRQIGEADEEGDRYVCPLDLYPHSALSTAVHQIVDDLCKTARLNPPQPMPRSSAWQRLLARLGRDRAAPPASLAPHGAGLYHDARDTQEVRL